VAGGIALARVATTGEPAGLVCSVPGNQTTEIAGIGVRVPFPPGHGRSLTTRLAQEAFQCRCCGLLRMREESESTAVLDSLRPANFAHFAPAQVDLSGVAARTTYPSHNQDDFGTTLAKIALDHIRCNQFEHVLLSQNHRRGGIYETKF